MKSYIVTRTDDFCDIILNFQCISMGGLWSPARLVWAVLPYPLVSSNHISGRPVLAEGHFAAFLIIWWTGYSCGLLSSSAPCLSLSSPSGGFCQKYFTMSFVVRLRACYLEAAYRWVQMVQGHKYLVHYSVLMYWYRVPCCTDDAIEPKRKWN